MIRKIKNGFTLIELLVYLAIFTIVAIIMTGILLSVTRVGQQESASYEVSGQLTFAVQNIERLIRNSSLIDLPAGVSTSTLILRMEEPGLDPTIIFMSPNIQSLMGIYIQQGVNPVASITNNKVVVNSLNFRKISQYPGQDIVAVDITLSYNSSSSVSQATRTASFSVARTSAAAFDADLVASTTNTYFIGNLTYAWKTIYLGDGSPASPSYTFADATNLGMFLAGANILGLSTAGVERMRIDSSGNVGIGLTSMADKLDVNGSAGNTTGVWATLSDIRLKKDINPINSFDALSLLTELQGVTFHWKDPQKDAEYGLTRGFIAQDVEKVLPEWVETDSSGLKSIDPVGINALLVESIKELKKENDAYRARINILETKIHKK